MSSIKKTLMKQGMKLMTDPRVMKMMQDERVMKAVMQMMNVPGKVSTFGNEQIEKLVERKASSPSLGRVRCLRAVDHPERFSEREQIECAPLCFRQVILSEGDEPVEMPLDKCSNHLVTQSFRGRIHREDLPTGDRICVAIGICQNDVFSGSQLSAVIETHWS